MLGLIDHIPLVGTIITRIIEDEWPSPREREQAARIAELERRLAWTNSYEGDRERRRRDETARRVGNVR
jgi:hypothetical protein